MHGWRHKGHRGHHGWMLKSVVEQAWQPLPEGAIPLSLLPEGGRGRIVSVRAGWRATQRAMSLGLAPGTIVEVVENNQNYPWTPIIVRVHGAQVAVGRGLASKIYVIPVGPGGGPGGPS